MLDIKYTTQFKKDLKLAKRRNKALLKLEKIINLIAEEKTLPPQLKDHALSGEFWRYRELHVEPDWLLIYKIIPSEKKVFFARTGTHSDLF